jgi:hypothetical protein
MGRSILRVSVWRAVALLGAMGPATVALHRAESINAIWIVMAGPCTYALGFSFYSKFIAPKVSALDARRANPLQNSLTMDATSRPATNGSFWATILPLSLDRGRSEVLVDTLAEHFRVPKSDIVWTLTQLWQHGRWEPSSSAFSRTDSAAAGR